MELLTICFLLFTLENLPLPFESEFQGNLDIKPSPTECRERVLAGEQYGKLSVGKSSRVFLFPWKSGVCASITGEGNLSSYHPPGP